MKRILAIILTIFLCATATAQMTNSIVIDGGSFRAVQTDALTGVNIDPIGLDHSRQACARVKIKFDRMTKEEIEALDVKMVSNTDLTKQKVAQYFDNVLILEMTAKPNTRFYVVHPNFGESNEVTLNLEGNREYEMLASLNQLYSIVVISNIPDVEILLDGNYKGVTDENCQLSVLDVTPGMHTLTYKFGSSTAQQNIAVHRKSIAFRQDVEMVAAPTQTPAQTKTYKVGDYYNENGKKGVVFEIADGGRHGKIVSMKQSAELLQWASDSAEQKRYIGADSKADGAANMAKVKAISGWKTKYPAFKWCAHLGKGWYLPSIEELKVFTLNTVVHDAVNRTLIARGGTKLYNRGELEWYWSSTEEDYNENSSGVFCAWCVDMRGDTYYAIKYQYSCVRAVSAF
ncbi:MAG: DUF1566 domain-containing protein [Rikenellaceae bacterium]|nr:DUF1566 domain-containing protein [Rikenellaceae bacterium]